MELLPSTPKIQRKFPVQEPLGEPAGPIDLFGQGRDSSQALSIGTRRSAGNKVVMNAATLYGIPANLDIPPSQMAYPMIRAEALGQAPAEMAGSVDYRDLVVFASPKIQKAISDLKATFDAGYIAALRADPKKLKAAAAAARAQLVAFNKAKLAAEKSKRADAMFLNVLEDVMEAVVYRLENNFAAHPQISLEGLDDNLEELEFDRKKMMAVKPIPVPADLAKAYANPRVQDALKTLEKLLNPQYAASLLENPVALNQELMKQRSLLTQSVNTKKALAKSSRTTRDQMLIAKVAEDLHEVIVYMLSNTFHPPYGDLDVIRFLGLMAGFRAGMIASGAVSGGLGQIPQLLRADRLPLMLNPNLGLKVGLPGELNVPPSYLAVPQIRREANFMQSPAETMRQFRLAMDHQANKKRLAGLGAGVAQPQKLMIPETDGSYDAEAFSSNYVDRIKAAVRIDYGEQQYAGYANAARAAQYQSPAFVGATYNYPEAFMRRGVSLAGGLGASGGVAGLEGVYKIVGGPGKFYSFEGGKMVPIADLPEGTFTYYNPIVKLENIAADADQKKRGIESTDYAAVTIVYDGEAQIGWVKLRENLSGGSPIVFLERLALGSVGASLKGAIKALLSSPPPGTIEMAMIQIMDPVKQSELTTKISLIVPALTSGKKVEAYNQFAAVFESLGLKLSEQVQRLILGNVASAVQGAVVPKEPPKTGVAGANNPPSKGKVPSWVWWTVGGVGGAAVLGTVLYFAFRKN
jgi:hypothetical protein